MDLKVDIHLAREKAQGLALVNMLMNIWIP